MEEINIGFQSTTGPVIIKTQGEPAFEYKGYSFWVTQDVAAKSRWLITDYKTGLKCCESKRTKAAAIKAAQDRFKKMGEKLFFEGMENGYTKTKQLFNKPYLND